MGNRGNELDALLQEKASEARTKRTALSAALVILCLALLGGGIFAVSTMISRSGGAEPAEPSEPQSAETDRVIDDTRPELHTHEIQLDWTDENVPDEQVTIQIIHNGERQTRLTLDADNGWTASWEDAYPASELALAAVFPEGAAATIRIEGDRFILSGSYIPPSESDEAASELALASADELPQTGLDWLPAIALFLLGAASLLIYGKLRIRGNSH